MCIFIHIPKNIVVIFGVLKIQMFTYIYKYIPTLAPTR